MSSNSVDFSVARDEFITSAFRVARIIGQDQTPLNGEIATAAQALNMIVKQWANHQDFAPGLKKGLNKRASLFLSTTDISYSLGPSGDNWTASYVSTSLSTNAAAAASTITLASTTGITAGDYIGITLDSGDIFWTTVVVAATTTITSALSGAAASGNIVYAYTTKARRPLDINTANLRDFSGKDTPIGVMSLEAYERIGDKTASGDPTRFYYESQLTNGVMYLDSIPSDTSKVISCVYQSPIEDFDAATDTADLPQHYYRPLKYQLGIDIWPEFKGGEVPQSLKTLRDESLLMANSVDPENSEIIFEPDRP